MLKLRQDQVWAVVAGGCVRIVRLERLKVGVKRMTDLATGEGVHEEMTKKEFCRLIKGGRLMTPDEVRDARV